MNNLDSAQQEVDLQRRLQAVIGERERMTRVLGDIENGRLAKGEIPADAYTYYGRINEVDRQIGKLSRSDHAEGLRIGRTDARKNALADRLTGYASVFQQPCAEACIASNFAAQIRAGSEHIDLSQRYEPATRLKRRYAMRVRREKSRFLCKRLPNSAFQ